MKKINIFAKMFLVVAFALVANSAFSANASFNDNASPHDPGASDLPTIMVRNKTTQGSCTTNCQWYTSISANPGDIVTVQIYYHNTSESISAVGTHVKLNTPSGSSTNFNISGSVSASNASTASGSASINISGGQNQTLDFMPGTVLWYAEKPLVNKNLLGAENNLFTSQGLFLGTVLPWGTCTVPGPYFQDAYCHRGFVTAQFKVSNNIVPPQNDVCDNLSGTQTFVPNGYYSSGGSCYPNQQQNNNNCTIDSFYAEDTNIDEGDDTRLHWNTSNCNSVSINGIGSVSLDGSVSTGSLYYDKTFTINAYTSYNWAPSDTDSVTIYVDEEDEDENCTIDEFYADDDDLENGDSTELFWETTDCDYVTISGIGSHMDPNDSEDTPDLYSDKTYTIHAYGDDSDDSDSLSIDVESYHAQTVYACNDGRDNDNDGKVDLYDLGCSSVFDNDEYNYVAPPVVQPPVVHTQYIYTNNNPAPVGNTLIELTIDSRNENVNAGDLIDYTVTYRNKSNKETFEDVIINVDFPLNVEFVKSQQGTFSEKDNELTIQLGTLAPNETGTIYMTGKVKNVAIENEVLVTRAIMAFKNNGSAMDTVIAYETNYVAHGGNGGSFLGALALFGDNGILPTTLPGWLLLILIIMAIVYLARKMYSKNSVAHQTIHTPYTSPARPYTPSAQTYSEHQPIATPPHDLPH